MNLAEMKKELIRDEGMRLKPYRCPAGKLTIGIGRNLEDSGISEAEADLLLTNDIARFSVLLDLELPWWKSLDEVRQRVLLNMAFNMGVTRLLGFTQTLGHVKAGRWKEAATGMKASKWAKQVGSRAARLAQMMETGNPVARVP